MQQSTIRTRPLRNIINPRRLNQPGTRQRNTINRIYPRRQPNALIIDDTLNRISNLPQQKITNDLFIDQFFNGSSFM
jgi:hypothetical protein